MNKSLFFNVLFNKGELICSGDIKSTNLSESVYGNFFSINAMVNKRSDLNVTSFRNFLFEMDNIPIKDQLLIWNKLSDVVTSVTYSGGKSLHAIISLEEPLKATPGSRQGVMTYKKVWERMAAYLDGKLMELGYRCGEDGFFDSACKNPSRLSRVPGAVRSNGKEQKLEILNSRLSKQRFINFFNFDYDEVKVDMISNRAVNNAVASTSEFWRICPTGLKNELRYVDWADSAGMYPKLLRLSLWAIDSTGVDKETLIEVLWEKTFPKLLEAGYPKQKLTTAVNHAYTSKRRA